MEVKISVIGDIINDSLNEKELEIMRHFSRTELKAAINMLKDSGKGLIERITNGIDAVLEKEKEKNGLDSPKTADDIVKVAFPHYYENKQNIKLR